MADLSTTPALVPASVSKAYEKIKPHVHRTPVVTSHTLDHMASNGMGDASKPSPKFKLFFKCENFQRSALPSYDGEVLLLIVVATTRRPWLWPRKTFDVPAWIIASTRSLCENVVLCGSSPEERDKAAQDIVQKHGTVGLELEEQVHELGVTLDAVITPLGGGGLLGGTANWFSDKSTLVFGSEPSFQGANDGERGLAQSPPARITSVHTLTIADGLRTPLGVHTWAVISDKSKVEAVFSVSEEDIKAAWTLVLERMKLVVEPSSVVPLAVVLFSEKFRSLAMRKQEENGKESWNVCIVLSGGNTTVDKIASLLS
ncbi:pyridoxal-phosphate dependent enzyme-domain-containing protein [Flagelloscypha sp. PMI_526]|nr:pyridoxal-phosphate dependent enzyme-domain-containing protein [Flagelloscypha sp. PMI_526]